MILISATLFLAFIVLWGMNVRQSLKIDRLNHKLDEERKQSNWHSWD